MSCARVFCASVTNCTVADVKKGKDNYMQAAQQLMHVELKQKSMDSFKTDRVRECRHPCRAIYNIHCRARTFSCEPPDASGLTRVLALDRLNFHETVGRTER